MEGLPYRSLHALPGRIMVEADGMFQVPHRSTQVRVLTSVNPVFLPSFFDPRPYRTAQASGLRASNERLGHQASHRISGRLGGRGPHGLRISGDVGEWATGRAGGDRWSERPLRSGEIKSPRMATKRRSLYMIRWAGAAHPGSASQAPWMCWQRQQSDVRPVPTGKPNAERKKENDGFWHGLFRRLHNENQEDLCPFHQLYLRGVCRCL